MDWSRREVLSLVAAGVAAAELPGTGRAAEPAAKQPEPPFAIRAITAGIQMSSLEDAGPLERALEKLARIRQRAQDDGMTVQTLRIATNPVIAGLNASQRQNALQALRRLDATAAAHQAILSIGPLLTSDQFEPELGDWAVELARQTRTINFSVGITSAPPANAPASASRPHPGGGINRRAVQSAAQIISKLSRVEASGAANFRFAAAALVPAGTPFFPVAYHQQQAPDSLAFGLESAGLVQSAFAGVPSFEEAEQRLRGVLIENIGPVERLALQAAAAEDMQYLGIDPSPAPSMTHSIGAAIEALTGQPFGHQLTLQACAAITGAIKTLSLRTCGYAGLMLPVLEDPVLARRAREKRYGIAELLLYSTVCGTGLDVVPIPGDTSSEELEKIISDVATLATRLRKPLAARLFPVPGKKAGDLVHFNDPRLTECRVFDVGGLPCS